MNLLDFSVKVFGFFRDFFGFLGSLVETISDCQIVGSVCLDHQVIVCHLSVTRNVCLHMTRRDMITKDNLILLHNWTRKTIGRLLVCGLDCLSGPDMVQTGWDGCRQTKNSLISGEQHFTTGNARVSSLLLL